MTVALLASRKRIEPMMPQILPPTVRSRPAGSIRWVYWIERIPIYQTKDYVQRVLENAVVYEALHPEKAPGGRARSLSHFLR